jgi:hypothetical protein
MFKVRWIFVRDIPNQVLRGIRLEYVVLCVVWLNDLSISQPPFHRNTQERKPVTNSRDTQELLPEAGTEMMRIFLTHDAKTSLLQDYMYYDVCDIPSSKAKFAVSSY